RVGTTVPLAPENRQHQHQAANAARPRGRGHPYSLQECRTYCVWSTIPPPASAAVGKGSFWTASRNSSSTGCEAVRLQLPPQPVAVSTARLTSNSGNSTTRFTLPSSTEQSAARAFSSTA